MKRISVILVFLISLVLLSGCISNNPEPAFPEGPGGFDRGTGFGGRGPGNLSQMDQRFQEMQQKAVLACDGKKEGDTCMMDIGRGNGTGICGISEEMLTCFVNRTRDGFRQQNQMPVIKG